MVAQIGARAAMVADRNRQSERAALVRIHGGDSNGANNLWLDLRYFFLFIISGIVQRMVAPDLCHL